MDKLYTNELIYSYKNPVHKGTITDTTDHAIANNLSCGDSLTLYFDIKDKMIKDIKYQGDGCVVSMGSAEIMSDYLIGKSLSDLKSMKKDDYLSLLGFELTPARQKCALIFYDAVQNFLKNGK